MAAPQSRKDFLEQCARMGWHVGKKAGGSLIFSKLGSVIIAADRRAYVADTLDRLAQADAYRRKNAHLKSRRI